MGLNGKSSNFLFLICPTSNAMIPVRVSEITLSKPASNKTWVKIRWLKKNANMKIREALATSAFPSSSWTQCVIFFHFPLIINGIILFPHSQIRIVSWERKSHWYQKSFWKIVHILWTKKYSLDFSDSHGRTLKSMNWTFLTTLLEFSKHWLNFSYSSGKEIWRMLRKSSVTRIEIKLHKWKNGETNVQFK